MKADASYFQTQKFFTPLTSFLPLFLDISVSNKIAFFVVSEEEGLQWQKGGKKLVRGVKN